MDVQDFVNSVIEEYKSTHLREDANEGTLEFIEKLVTISARTFLICQEKLNGK